MKNVESRLPISEADRQQVLKGLSQSMPFLFADYSTVNENGIVVSQTETAITKPEITEEGEKKE